MVDNRHSTENEPEAEYVGWRIDKHIPIAVLVALLLQTSGIVWWASSITSRVDMLEKSTSSWQASREKIPERVTRVEVSLESINASLLRIERKLDNEVDKMNGFEQKMDK